MRLQTSQAEGDRALLTELTEPTELLDFKSPQIQQLIVERRWQALPEFERIGAIYDFVRNEIKFGYNQSDSLPASQVLADGFGQCNTKGILLMALLRANQFACRFHGFTIDKRLQKGAITGWAYVLAPASIIHSWVEIWFDGRCRQCLQRLVKGQRAAAVRKLPNVTCLIQRSQLHRFQQGLGFVAKEACVERVGRC